MARQGNPGDNPTASGVLDALNSGEELSSDESDECDNTSDLEITEERSEQGSLVNQTLFLCRALIISNR